nr:uncharacterized protein LOC112012988 [Quercus suber]
MPFGLKNAGSTYQRMMTKMFEPQLGRSIEVYIDDIVVKSKAMTEHVTDLTNTFEVLRKHKLRLNASKCSFGVSSGNFLGYMVTHRGIEVNPDQIKAISSLQSPRNPKEVQRLTGMTVALNRFISRSADRPRTSVKGQVLTNLVTDFAEGPEEIETSPHGMDEKSVTIEKSLRLGFSATNNEAEYEAMLMGMAMVRKLGGKTVEIFSDSKLIMGQVRGELEAWDTKMQEYLGRVRRLQVNFESFEVTHVPRSENAHADSLATLATSSVKNLPRVIMVEDLNTSTLMTGDLHQVNQIRSALSWMDPIKLFLEKDILPEDKSEAKKIRRKAPRFWLSEDKKLYKRSYSGPYLLCVHPEASEALLEELHEGICGSHTGGRSLSHRAITQEYWWPGM